MPGQAPPPPQPWDPHDPPPPDPLILSAWFEDPDRQAIEAVIKDCGASASWLEIPDTDWEAQSRVGLRPVQISDQLVIAPPWDAPPGALIIEPGQGFGTGSHPTTRQALHALVRLAPRARSALDVGTGSGILALAAARLGLEVRGIDVDPTAIRDAERHAHLNGLSVAFSTTPLDQLDQPADLVLANLHAELLVALAPELIQRTGHALILAGILEDREPLLRARYDPALELEDRAADGAWISLVYVR
ncbi:MAG TPA: methyltransferase domain-containing protein [Deltaproteobacteria bacterium]|nr:methyltransferase domain-containing protein [Deltaproteobacteria bacterium]